MRKLKLIFLIMLVLLGWYCGKENRKTENNTETSKSTKITGDDHIILTINDDQFTNANLREFIKSRYPDFSFTDVNARLASRIFDMFIEHNIILHSVDQANIQLAQEDMDNYLKRKTLPQEQEDDPWTKESAKAQKYLYFKLYKDIDVTETEIRQYYDSHIDQYRKSKEILLCQIVVNDKNKAYQIREILSKSPEKFAELAKKESISVEASNGGSMGYFEKGTLPKDMENVVFALELNTISPVVESPYGFHIFKVTKIRNERLEFLETVKNQIQNKLLAEKMNAAYENFLDQSKKELNIKATYEALFFPYQSIKGEQNVKTN